MLPERVSNPGPLTYESGAGTVKLDIAVVERCCLYRGSRMLFFRNPRFDGLQVRRKSQIKKIFLKFYQRIFFLAVLDIFNTGLVSFGVFENFEMKGLYAFYLSEVVIVSQLQI